MVTDHCNDPVPNGVEPDTPPVAPVAAGPSLAEPSNRPHDRVPPPDPPRRGPADIRDLDRARALVARRLRRAALDAPAPAVRAAHARPLGDRRHRARLQ